MFFLLFCILIMELDSHVTYANTLNRILLKDRAKDRPEVASYPGFASKFVSFELKLLQHDILRRTQYIRSHSHLYLEALDYGCLH